MIKIMIVDDDKLARIGLAKLINWKDYNMEIAFETSNGKDALDYAQLNTVDLAFIDLEMPAMNGLELLKKLKVISPNTNSVIITMHNDFKYIQEALRIGIMDYIIKSDFGGEELLEIIDRLKKRLDNSAKGDNETNQCIIKAIGIIKSEKDKYYSANEMANKVNLSRSYFSTCFKQVTGKSFNEYVREVKLNMAKELLETTDKSIFDISKEIGFTNEKYFSTLFKAHMGMSPSDYRKGL